MVLEILLTVYSILLAYVLLKVHLMWIYSSCHLLGIFITNYKIKNLWKATVPVKIVFANNNIYIYTLCCAHSWNCFWLSHISILVWPLNLDYNCCSNNLKTVLIQISSPWYSKINIEEEEEERPKKKRLEESAYLISLVLWIYCDCDYQNTIWGE